VSTSRLSRAATEKWEFEEYPVHECTEDEVTKKIFENGHLHFCLPLEIMKFKNDFDFLNEISVAFRVRPNYDKVKNKNDKDAGSTTDGVEDEETIETVNKECENFSMGRS